MGGTLAEDAATIDALPRYTGEDLLRAVPEISSTGEVECVTTRRMRSDDETLTDILEVAQLVTRALKDGAGGVVVAHGTDTLEEISFALDVLVNSEAPVVVTGAMRRPGVPGADGFRNLISAFMVARADTARGLGTLIVFDDTVHSARFVIKGHTNSIASFRSSTIGPIGWLSEGDVRIGARPRHQRRIAIRPGAPEPRVGILKVFLGCDGAFVQAIAQLKFDGLVVEGFGGGNVPASLAPELERMSQRVPVIIASRVGEGEVLRRTYGFAGDGADLLRRGLISGGSLSAGKSQVLLALLLMSGLHGGALKRTFEEMSLPADG
jgi:L-asparaginase